MDSLPPPEEPRTQLCMDIQGEVQGVGFRDFVEEKAIALNVTGWTHNTMRGTVEVLAQGVRKALEELLEACRIGPPRAKVSNVVTRWEEPSEIFTDFNDWDMRRMFGGWKAPERGLFEETPQ